MKFSRKDESAPTFGSGLTGLLPIILVMMVTVIVMDHLGTRNVEREAKLQILETSNKNYKARVDELEKKNDELIKRYAHAVELLAPKKPASSP